MQNLENAVIGTLTDTQLSDICETSVNVYRNKWRHIYTNRSGSAFGY